MNNDFDMSIVGARELSDNELALIQGGSLWSWVKGAVSDVGHAATSVWNAVSSPKGQNAVKTVGGIIGVIGGIVAIFAKPSNSDPAQA